MRRREETSASRAHTAARRGAPPADPTHHEPNRAFGMQTVEGPPIHAHIMFEPSDDGTRFRIRLHRQPAAIMRLGQPTLKPILRRNFTGYCATLKQVVESGG
jgi:hypothetical protein